MSRLLLGFWFFQVKWCDVHRHQRPQAETARVLLSRTLYTTVSVLHVSVINIHLRDVSLGDKFQNVNEDKLWLVEWLRWRAKLLTMEWTSHRVSSAYVTSNWILSFFTDAATVKQGDTLAITIALLPSSHCISADAGLLLSLHNLWLWFSQSPASDGPTPLTITWRRKKQASKGLFIWEI